MKSTLIKWGLAGIAACGAFSSMAQQINPMTEAVIRNYSDILAENPKDYITLYDRATQYLNIGDLTRALSDIDMALQYTPDKDSDYRLAELSLKSDILSAQKDFNSALKVVEEALKINPSDQTELYKGGNLYLLLNNPSEALKMFQRLQRESPRSQEAFYGMAKANAMMGKTDEAVKLIEEVESLGKQSFVTYCRIGDLYADLDKIPEATSNYMIAYSMSESSRPVESLKLLVKKNPQLVMESIDKAINDNSENLALNYVKAIIAYDAGMYNQAEAACVALAQGLDQPSAAVYRMIALSQLALNRVDDAKKSIAQAEAIAPDNGGIILDKAQIYLSDSPEEALKLAESVLAKDADNEDNLMLAAKAAILAGKYKEAVSYLNNVILSGPSNVEALLLRGYVNSDFLKEGKAGVNDYTRASNVKSSGNARELALTALGKAKIGKKLDADGMINDAITKAGNNNDDLYIIAIYFAQTGNLEKAKEFADKAMANGYNNIYNIKTNNEPLFNLSPIHHLFK